MRTKSLTSGAETCQVQCCKLCLQVQCRACQQPLGPERGFTGLVDGLCGDCVDEIIENSGRPANEREKKKAGNKLLKVAEVARLLKYNPTTVRRKIKNGTLPAFKIGDSGSPQYRVPYNECIKLLKANHSA